uniref:Uncharacterized protein MANES_09G021600 n=1 Tax=Rhizophora mucronata TaxID=61149 RepID=A0A2P2IKW5_RHIMU
MFFVMGISYICFFFFFFCSYSRVKHYISSIKAYSGLGSTTGYPDRVLQQSVTATAAAVAVVVEIVMVVLRVGWRMIVHASSLWAMRIKPSCHSHPCIQQFHVLPHL